jgi:hypothetical protein
MVLFCHGAALLLFVSTLSSDGGACRPPQSPSSHAACVRDAGWLCGKLYMALSQAKSLLLTPFPLVLDCDIKEDRGNDKNNLRI